MRKSGLSRMTRDEIKERRNNFWGQYLWSLFQKKKAIRKQIEKDKKTFQTDAASTSLGYNE